MDVVKDDMKVGAERRLDEGGQFATVPTEGWR